MAQRDFRNLEDSPVPGFSEFAARLELTNPTRTDEPETDDVPELATY